MKWNTCLKEFENFLKFERNLSQNTIQSYLSDLKKLIKYLEIKNNNNLPHEIKVDIIREFLYLESKKIKASTQGRLISSLNLFFDFLILEKILIENPVEKIDYPKIGFTIPTTLTTDEIDLIIANARLNKNNGLRNETIIEVLYSCGLRVSELINLKISDLYLSEQLLKVIGKGNKERFVPISQTAKKLIVQYIEFVRNSNKVKKGHEDTLFINNRGKKLTRIMIYTILNSIAKEIGIKKKVSPHVLRHSFATHLIENGADIISIQKMMGHENIVTTEKYLHVRNKHLKESVLKYHPRA
tara:strand:- start:2599 stop:3495 length:897 start_codon:yes stop_codon:yes gene_type:complete